MWIASLSQEHGISDTARGILYALIQSHTIMFLFHVAIELTLRYQANTEEGKKTVLAGDLLFTEKTKREKQRERRRKCLPSPWYYLSMWQLLQRGMKDAGGTELRCASS